MAETGRATAGPRELTGRIRVSVATSLAGKAAEMATLLLLATVVPRALGPEDYGRFAVPLTIVTIGSLALTLGGPTLMARFVPAAPPEDRIAVARALGARLARGRAAQLAALGVAAGVAVVWDPARFPPVETALVTGALVLNVGTTLALQVSLGLGRTGGWSVRYPLQNAVLIVAVLVLHPAAGATGAVVAILLAAAATAPLGVAAVAPIVGVGPAGVPLPVGALRFGVLHGAGAALVQVSHRGGVLVVALLAGSATQAGFAALAIGIALGVTYAVLQAFTVSLPHLADGSPPVPAGEAPESPIGLAHRRSGRHRRPTRAPVAPAAGASTAEAESVLRRLAGGLLAALVPVAALGALLLDAAVPAVFGSDYRGAASTFGPALALIVLAPLNALTVQAAALRLRPEAALASGVAAALAFLLTAVIAVPLGGAVGATTAALAGAAASGVVSLWLLPGAAGGRITAASFGGAAGVLVLAAMT